MALLKTINETLGAQSSYHRITELRDPMDLSYTGPVVARVQVESYASEQEREAGGERLHKDVEVVLEPVETATVKRVLYEAMRRSPAWEGADDHVEPADPNILPLLSALRDGELSFVYYEAQRLLAERGVDPATYEADYQAYLQPPQPVADLSASATTEEITLSWTDPTGPDLYRIEVAWGNQSESVAPGTESYVITGLDAGTEYQITVASVDVYGNRAEARITTVTQEL
jgi:hypothetical protein